MSSLFLPSTSGKKSEASTVSSTTNWRAFWTTESRRCGSDWIAIAETASSDHVSAGEGIGMTACPTCGSEPCGNAAFCRACRDADRRKAQGKQEEINRAARDRYNEAPEAIYNAVVYELRTYGLPQLKNANCQRRLSDLSAAQVKNLMASLQRRRGQYPNVSDEFVGTLATIYDARVMANEQ
jgi:hypothetical protein